MTPQRQFLAAAILLAACSDTGPIYPLELAPYDWVRAPESVSPQSDRAPVITDPVVNFRLDRGEKQSTLRAKGEFNNVEWRIGSTYLYGFDVRLDRRSLRNEHVLLSRLSREGNPAVEIVAVHLDARGGVTVMGRTCIAPAEFADWHRVEVRIKLSDNDNGYVEVFCDREPLWARTGLRTTFPPMCRRSKGCDAPVPASARYDLDIGLISEDGVATPVFVQMRRLHYRPLLYKPNRVGNL
jgi:hypothetical protein